MKFWTRRRARDRRIGRSAAKVSVILGAVVLASAAGIPAGASVPASAPGPGWSVMSSPNPVGPNGQLSWVSCPAASSCVAVGTAVNKAGTGVPLAERWDGTTWRIQRIPSPPGAAWSLMLGVSCPSPSACEAVGVTVSGAGVWRPVAARWDGASWQIQPTASSGASYLIGVSCTSATACTAVGGPAPGASGKALAERWDGTSWQLQPAPSPAGAFLSGVACTSSSACTAVGGSGAGPLAERWNGTTWSTQAAANPPQGGGFLNSVACLSSSACTAVGNSNAGNLAEQWNGTGWQIQPAANPAGAQFTLLNTVACATASGCIAAGFYADSSGAVRALTERPDGGSWAIQRTPRLPGGVMSQLLSVTCTSATGCLAVGVSNPDFSTNDSPATLAERWDGSAWRVEHTPNPLGAAGSNLQGGSCVSTSSCTAVGYTFTSGGTPLPLAQRWDGHSWRLQATPRPAAGGILTGVACPSRSSCMAVGGHGNPNAFAALGTLAERWNGHAWRIQPTPNPRGGGAWTLGSVSCTSPSACTAVGGSLEPAGKPQGTLAERWNGRKWRIQATPSLPGTAVKILAGVACTSRSSCLAVGGEFDPATGETLGTLAERWNGRAWRIVPTYKPAPGGRGAFLNGVACATATACTAVGNQTPTRTLAERWNGQSWHVQATPNPAGGQPALASVACPTSATCTAFGLNFTGSGPATVAERWSGGRWRLQPTPALVGYDVAFPGVTCPAPSVCYALSSFTNDGPGVSLVEQWNRAGTSTRVAAGRQAAPVILPSACMPRSLPISGRTPAPAWSRFGAGRSLGRTGAPSPASRIRCGAA